MESCVGQRRIRLGKLLSCVLLASLAGTAQAQSERTPSDPTSLWLSERWQAVLDAREAKRLAIEQGNGGGSSSDNAFRSSDSGNSADEHPTYELPIYWTVTASGDPRDLGRNWSESADIRGPVVMLYESVFGELPYAMADWFRPSRHDAILDWESSFRSHLEEHMLQAERDFPASRVSGITDPIVILDYERVPLAWTSAVNWVEPHAVKWRDAVRQINSPEIDPEFVRLAGLDVSVETWGELERLDLADDFYRDSYNGFVRVVVGSTLGLMRSMSPEETRVGVYGMPKGQVSVPSYATGAQATIREHNDQLQWLYEETDVIAPSYYRMPLIDPEGDHPGGLSEAPDWLPEKWYEVNVGEAHRVRDAYAPSSEIIPFVWYHYHDHSREGRQVNNRIPMLTPENARYQIEQLSTRGVDGVFLWGTVGEWYVDRGHASQDRVIEHFERYWLPHLKPAAE